VGGYAVVGLGNVLQGDEGLGYAVVARLRATGQAARAQLIDGGTVGLGLLPYLDELDGLIVVDAVDAARVAGSLIDLDGRSLLAGGPLMGVHDLGARELLGALLFVDRVPRRVRVVGAQPERIGLGTDLSPAVAAAVGPICARTCRWLGRWEREDRPPGRRCPARPGEEALVAAEDHPATPPRLAWSPTRLRDHPQRWRRRGRTSSP
jgi:hydrogenase maturation protease